MEEMIFAGKLGIPVSEQSHLRPKPMFETGGAMAESW